MGKWVEHKGPKSQQAKRSVGLGKWDDKALAVH